MYLRCGDKGIQTIAGQVRLWTTAHYLSGNFLTGVKDNQREIHTKPLLHYTNFYVLCACVCMCECRLTCTMEHMWRSEVNSQELVITFCLVLRQGLFCYFMLYHVKAGWSQVSRWFSHLCLPLTTGVPGLQIHTTASTWTISPALSPFMRQGLLMPRLTSSSLCSQR